jgi:CDP-diacylglycerol---serine O-phosphatidyltransferase
MDMFPPFEPELNEPKKQRLRDIPLRVLIPNILTLLAIGAGLTSIRLTIEGKLELALGAIIVAAILDGLDGRVARMLKGTSRFGAELDSLADFVNFGVAPALVIYFWGLKDLKSLGWIAALVFAVCAALRLARFNIMSDDKTKPAFTANFFTGMPAPMGALCVLLPIYIEFIGVPHAPFISGLALIYTIAIAMLMVSNVPTFSGKKLGLRVPRERVLPIFVFAVLAAAILLSYTWEALTLATIAYLGFIPFGVIYYRKLEAAHLKAVDERLK